jgi:hypothetical protein
MMLGMRLLVGSRCRGRRGVASAGAGRLMIGLVVAVGLTAVAATPASAASVAFTAAGCTVWPVPPGVVSMQIEAVGAAGQPSFNPFAGYSHAGGPGDQVAASVSVPMSGQPLDVCVDQSGGAGQLGGGAGGGASGVSAGSDFSAPLLVAGGGGGGGYGPDGGMGGAAQASGEVGSESGAGGGGGGSTAAPGAGGAWVHGGSSGADGAAPSPSGPGLGGTGGNGAGDGWGGGGGGGGDYGGGGGGGDGSITTGQTGSGGGGGGADFCSTAADVSGCAETPGAGTGTGAGSAVGDAQVILTYLVADPPIATILTPVNGGTYTVGQVVQSSYHCAEGAGGNGLQSCQDSSGASGGSGTLDTSAEGVHTYTVTATSKDGLTGTAAITYTVSPATTSTTSTSTTTVPTTTTPGGSGPAHQTMTLRIRIWVTGAPVVWCWGRGCRYPNTSLRFDLNRPATLRLVLRTRIHGHWRQAAITSIQGHRGDNRRRIAGRWHGDLVPARAVQILVQIRHNSHWKTAKTIHLTVRHKHQRPSTA